MPNGNELDEKDFNMKVKFFTYLVANLGFPIAVSAYLLWEIKPILTKINENLVRLTYLIETLAQKVN